MLTALIGIIIGVPAVVCVAWLLHILYRYGVAEGIVQDEEQDDEEKIIFMEVEEDVGEKHNGGQ